MNTILFKSYCDKEYLLQKVGAYYEASEGDRAGSKQIIEYMAALVAPTTLDIPVADEKSERAQLSSEQLAKVNAWIRVGLKQIEREFPLVAGESIDCDTFTFLTADFRSYPQGTPVLVRETNKATMVHFFPCSVYRNGSMEPGNQARESPAPIQLLAPAAVGDGDAGSIIRGLFKGIASAIGGEMGAAIFDAIFPESSDDMAKMLQDLQDNIKVIFRQELDDKTITDLNLKIQGVSQYMRETYLLQKKNGADVARLEGLLTTENEKMYTHLMALLTGERYRAKGIAYLVIGANAHLAILQELAAITLQSNPQVSAAYTANYHARLEYYISALNSAIFEVHQSRLDYLGQCQESTLKGAATDRWWFVDNWANYTSDQYSNTYSWDAKSKGGGGDGFTFDAQHKANHARDEYFKSTFHPTIVNDLQIYVDMKDAWAACK